ncbi:Protein of unknown function [Bacillus cereus]|nr:Protein of unknown function [Bacillus cereus]
MWNIKEEDLDKF